MPELPAIIGTDLAGVVEAVGEGVTQFQVGDEVYGLTGGVRGLQGSLAQYAAVDANLLAIKPRNLSMLRPRSDGAVTCSTPRSVAFSPRRFSLPCCRVSSTEWAVGRYCSPSAVNRRLRVVRANRRTSSSRSRRLMAAAT